MSGGAKPGPTKRATMQASSTAGSGRLAVCCLLVFAGIPGSPSARSAEATRGTDLSLRGVFTSDLPEIGRKHSLRLLLHPHFGDLIKYDYFRSDVGLKYSLSHHLEFSAASAGYFGHGLRNAKLFDEFGFGELKLAAKYRLGDRLLPGWDGAVGARYSTPINHPPVDVTDGLEHRTLFTAFARHWESHPHVRLFWGVGLDLVRATSTPGRHDDNELRDDNSYFSGGLILDRGRTHYTLEGRWTTTRFLGHNSQDAFEVRPGVIWELGRPRNEGMRSRWILGLAVSTTFGPDGTEFDLGARVRLDLDFKRLWRRGPRPSPQH